MDQDADHGFLSPPLCEEASYPRGMSDQEVADFLEQNPDFFVSRPHLLQNMTPRRGGTMAPSSTCNGIGSTC